MTREGRVGRRSWPLVLAIAAAGAFLGAFLAIWVVVFQAPRDLHLNATEFWLEYVTPRAITRFLLLGPALAGFGATASTLFLRDRLAPSRAEHRSAPRGSLFESRTLAFLHLIAAGCFVVSAIAVVVLLATQSQSALGSLAVFGPGIIATVFEGAVVNRVAHRRAVRGGVSVTVERFRVQRELISLSAVTAAMATVRRQRGRTHL